MASEIMKTYDTNRNGFLSKNEMKGYFRSLLGDDTIKESCPASIRESFESWYQQIDLEKDGRITPMDLACYLQTNLGAAN